jgi:hypothetical protein
MYSVIRAGGDLPYRPLAVDSFDAGFLRAVGASGGIFRGICRPHFQDLHPPIRKEHGRRPATEGEKVTPIRFVCGCENGHLQDIDWRRPLHPVAPEL